MNFPAPSASAPDAAPGILGLLPSLEVLPLFADGPSGGTMDGKFPFRPRAFASYGEIARNLLTRKITGGILPWEIFVAEVLALPGQRNGWKVPIFLNPCPTEMVLRDKIYKAFYASGSGACRKLPARLRIGIESQSSLAKAQSRQWLSYWSGGSAVKVEFKMLPMDLMIHALQAEAIDAIIAPTPWGIHAEAAGLGKLDWRFVAGKFPQRLALVCQREFSDSRRDLSKILASGISHARHQLADPAAVARAGARMALSGKPSVHSGMYEEAASLHSFRTLNRDFVPDLGELVAELMCLDHFSVLPSQVAPNEQTAQLLLAY